MLPTTTAHSWQLRRDLGGSVSAPEASGLDPRSLPAALRPSGPTALQPSSSRWLGARPGGAPVTATAGAAVTSHSSLHLVLGVREKARTARRRAGSRGPEVRLTLEKTGQVVR